MTVRQPRTDARRAAALAAELDRAGSAMVPDWAPAVASGSFGRALLEIAARLAEETSSRLDRTAARDALAFYDTLDLPPPAPQAATATLVLVTEEARTTATSAPPRVQVGATVDGREVLFETTRALEVTPARIADVVAVDTDTDHIERAPGRVVATEPPPAPVGGRLLVTAAAAGSTVLQVAPAIGLEPGDQLRIGATPHRVGSVSGDLVTLVDPLPTAVPGGTAFEEIEALETFALRDLQQHACFIGHAALFDLERPARIELELTPPGLAARLAALDLRYSLWGTLHGEQEPGWQALELVGGSGATLTVRKRWTGTVDEVEVDGRTSRWLRIEHLGPITTVGVGAEVDMFRVTVRSDEPTTSGSSTPAPEPIGSRTITHAFHDAVPLAVSGRFLPFGPTPTRFDVFSFAAPEALSKPGAKVDLDIRLADASLLALVPPVGADPSGTPAYGVGANGRPYSLTISSGSNVRWRELPTPTAENGTPVALDGSAGLLAIRAAVGLAVDVLVARDRAGGLWSGTGLSAGGAWQPVRDGTTPVDLPLGDLVLVPSTAPGTARLLRVHGGELQTMEVGRVGPGAAWETVARTGSGPDLDHAVAMAPVAEAARGAGAVPTEVPVVLAAADGTVWLGRIRTAGGRTVEWRRLSPTGARVDVRPAAVVETFPDGGSRLWVAWADVTGGIGGWSGSTVGTAGTRRGTATPAFDVAAGSSIRVASQAWAPSTIQPLTTAVAGRGAGNRAILAWFDADSVEVASLPPDAAARPPTDVVIVGPGSTTASARPLLVLPTTGEALAIAPLDQRPATRLTYTLHDGLAIRQAAASHYVELVAGAGRRVASLSTAAITLPVGRAGLRDRVYEVTGGLTTGTTYQFLRRLGKARDVAGELRAANELRLGPADTRTATGHLVIIGDRTHQVTAIDDTSAGQRIATISPPLALATGSVTYTPVDRQGSTGTVTADDVQTLVRLSVDGRTGRTVLFDDGVPSLQPRRSTDLVADGRWWRLARAWTRVPTSGTAALLGRSTIGSWTVRALERGYDNPELSWEFFDGDGWRRLEQDFVDGTHELAVSGRVSFRVPATLSATEIGGRTDLWIRARLVGGDYGRPKFVVTTRPEGDQSVQTTTIDTDDLHPPEISSIEASFVGVTPSAPESVLTVDNLATLDQTQASASDQARFALFSGARAIDADLGGRALYVGLTRRPVSPLVLYAVLDDQDTPGTLAVEVLTSSGWRHAAVDDETGALHRTGLVQVFLPAAPARATRFGREGFWLRLRPAPGATGAAPGAWQPVVRGLFPNGVPARQARTVVQEILGSSRGEPALVLDLAERPVLPETLELRVREELGEDEQRALEERRREAIRNSGRPPSEAPPVVATVAGDDGTWVLWHRVDSFIGTDGAARVYRLDPATGRVTFGDGRQGKVPPAGNDAVRAFRYQQGGGRQGNAPAWSDLSLTSALQGIEAVVLPADAAGGVDDPGATALLDTAPARLRHAGRGLTVADLEALAVAAAAEVVRARCARPMAPGDPIRVAVAVRDGSRRPVPSLAMRAAIARSLHAAGWGALPARRLRVEPPAYVDVAVSVRLRAPAALAAQVEQASTSALGALLHPTDGGPDGRGWPFGRRLWESDVLRTLQAVDGIDRVDGVTITRLDGRPLDDVPGDGLVAAATADIDVHVEPVQP